MKLSKATLAVLKNFSSINGGIQFMEGNEIRIASIDKTVIGVATVEETFPHECAIYDLSQFLSVVSMFDQPELEFEEDFVIIKQGRRRVKYFYTDSRNIVAPPYDLDYGTGESQLFVSADQLQSLQKASSIMKLEDFSVVKEGDTIQMIVEDGEQDSNNEYTIDLDFEVDLDDFDLSLKMKTLNFLPFDYNIELADDDTILIFSNDEHKVKYYCPVQD